MIPQDLQRQTHSDRHSIAIRLLLSWEAALFPRRVSSTLHLEVRYLIDNGVDTLFPPPLGWYRCLLSFRRNADGSSVLPSEQEPSCCTDDICQVLFLRFFFQIQLSRLSSPLGPRVERAFLFLPIDRATKPIRSSFFRHLSRLLSSSSSTIRVHYAGETMAQRSCRAHVRGKIQANSWREILLEFLQYLSPRIR